MNTDKGERLKSIGDATVFGDTGVAFTITTQTGKQLRVHCPLAEIADIICALVGFAKSAQELMNTQAPSTSRTQSHLVPIPIDGIGFAAAQTLDETLLVVRLSGFDLAFAVPSNELARLASDFARIGKTLSASGEQIQ